MVSSTELLAARGDTVVIGSDSQANNGGVNSSQSANNFPGGGPPLGLLGQDSLNSLASAIILGA